MYYTYTAGVEKQKFVYIMNRDSANRLTISSPLEAHKNETILFSLCGVDVGFDNPIFAMIELEYTEADQDPSGEAFHLAEKKLTYYELDLGLNHVVRKWSEPISRKANLLLTVPGGDDGPSGVLICGENWVSYKHQGHPEVRTPLPRRDDYPPEKDLLITCATLLKQKDMYFYILQSEVGDLYKVTIETSADKKTVENLIVSVFDSIQPANSFCITKTGLLFVASEFGDHSLFQFQGIGDDENAARAERIADESLNMELGDDAASASRVAPPFRPSARLSNLLKIDDMSSLAPVTDLLVEEMAGEDAPQIHVLCGRGYRSSLRVLRHGISVSEEAVSELPGRPTAVWAVRGSQDSGFDKYIVVSFTNATLVLSIGETVEEVVDSGFFASASTLAVVLLADNALLQVHTNGITHIRPDKRQSQWKPPGKKQIEKATANARQVAISVAGGEIFYFELDAAGQLMEMTSSDYGLEIACLDIGEVPEGRVGSPFLAVGFWDNTVRILSLDHSDLLKERATAALQARPESVCLAEMARDVRTSLTAASTGGAVSVEVESTLYLHVGLVNGVLHRVSVDPVTGFFSDKRQRFLGGLKPVKLFRVVIQGQRSVLALSTRAWLMYYYQGKHFQQPMSYETLEHASNFSSELCPEGIVSVAGNTLRILTVSNLGATFNQTSHPLRYTPRKMCRMPDTRLLIVVESDHNEYSEAEKAALAAASGAMAVDDAADDEEATILPLRGPVPPADGKWASCVRVIEPSTGETRDLLELSENEAAFSVCSCRFLVREEETFIIVGTSQDLTLHPRRVKMGYLNVYRLVESKLQLLHKTEVEDVPIALCAFQGKLLVGVGKSLRLYELGKKKLLRKCENKLFPSMVVKITTYGDRIYVGDMAESVHFAKYKRLENSLVIFADDTIPRYMTALTCLDYDSISGADKFGNVFCLRLPDNANDDVDNPSGSRLLWDQGLLNGAPTKAELMTHYYLGEAVTCMQKCSLFPGKVEVIVVATVTGGVFAFLPFSSKEDVSFYQHLEMFLRQECPNLCQRDHLSYRSYFQPVKSVIDGDLCERYGSLPLVKQQELANDIDRTPTEIMKKLEDVRAILL